MEQTSILDFLRRPDSVRPDSSRPQHSHRDQPYRRNNTHTRKHHSSNQNRAPDRRRNMGLKLVADETKKELARILHELPQNFDVKWSCLESLDHPDSAPLPADWCPALTAPCTIQVLDMDSFDAAIQLDPTHTAHQHVTKERSGLSPEKVTPVAVLNLASERSPGGGWHKGALAQEECLCYRSSLHLSLDPKLYPIPPLSAIYSPNVVIIRESISIGHKLYHNTPPPDLPAVSVISVAALRQPELSDNGKEFRNPGVRSHTKKNIRLILRVAARHGHRKLVLGALGCGVFANPPRDVATCFLEVFREPEFQGGWWEKIVFAVMDNVNGPDGGKGGKGNFGQFYQVLHGQIV
ncbi:hypothetical protein G6011_11175 [Alternaria panax]|uniref:Microbial-type PARG catalytic domain-containing protein n=1 Tax=Alternaria panax TaxID=48097 RepID=A0AAD4NPH3_9PLEO|nr:hypothetical protein G6011_11175 [Alternaria panax]